MAFALVSEAMDGTCRPEQARGNRVGSCTLPPLRPYSEACDEAVAASRLLLSRKSTSMLEPLKTGADLLR
jgi:hypothetical protein